MIDMTLDDPEDEEEFQTLSNEMEDLSNEVCHLIEKFNFNLFYTAFNDVPHKGQQRGIRGIIDIKALR